MTMPGRRGLAALCLLSLAASGTALAQGAGPITVEQPWARAAIQGGTAGIFLTIRNNGSTADRLVAASSPLPRVTELHTTLRDGDVMRMQQVHAIEVPAGGSVTLRPGGLHLMLIGLAAPLQAGATAPLTLTFEQAGQVTLQVPVMAAGAAAPHAHR